jgi:branched-chain amino acid transport system permease protein
MAAAFQLLYQFGDAFAFLVIAASGLAVIFGMMGIINLAHGEFIMCGAYATVFASRAGLPLPLAIATGAATAGLVGMALERLVIRRLYHRPIDSIVATWGISLIATQGVLILLGSTMQGIGTPFGSVTVGAYSYSIYRLVLFASAVVLLLLLYLLFYRTRFGVVARATIQLPHMARALGVDTGRVYTLTFGLGAALAGLAGLMQAPILTVQIGMGENILILAFVITVIGGIGSIRGALVAAIFVGFIDTLGRAFFPDLLRMVLSPAAAATAGPALSSMLIYLLMAVVLVVKPEGLFSASGK